MTIPHRYFITFSTTPEHPHSIVPGVIEVAPDLPTSIITEYMLTHHNQTIKLLIPVTPDTIASLQGLMDELHSLPLLE